MNRPDNNIKSKIRELLESYEPEFVEGDWLKMKKKLKSSQTKTSFKEKTTIAKIIYLSKYAAVILLCAILPYTYFHSKVSLVSINSDKKKVDIVLSDGTHVWLNNSSTLTYPKKFNQNIREVSLVGEAYFEVTKNPTKSFIVNTPASKVIVIGTSFNIKAPIDEKCEIISVAEGIVKIISKQSNSNINIAKGEQSIIYKEKTNMVKGIIQDANFLSWKTNKLEFSNTPLSQVVKILNSYYNKPIVLKNDSLGNVNLTVKFDNEPLDEVIKIIVLTLDIEAINEGDTIRLKVKSG